jgi:hypothetical protein
MVQASVSLSPRTKFYKRHYEAIALAMQEAMRRFDDDSPYPAGVVAAIEELADVFARDDGRFRRERFVSACVPGANVRARNGASPTCSQNR